MNGRFKPPPATWRKNPRFSRRTLLSGLAAGGMLGPLLPLLNASGAEEQPVRLILWFTPHGTIYDNWKPSGGETDFVLGPILGKLERHRKKLVILDGLKVQADGVGAPHTKGPPLLWTASPLLEDQTFTREDESGGRYFGWNSAASVDQFILGRRGSSRPYPSLEFGVRSGGSHPGSRMIYTGPKTPLAPETDPWQAFKRLIGDIGKTNEELERIRAERRSVLDLVSSEIADVQQRVSRADAQKIDAHLSIVRDIETRLQNARVACVGPDLGTAVNSGTSSNTPQVFDRMMELMAATLACDLTRVASMQYRVGENDGGYLYDWLGISAQEHHLLSHEGDTNATARANLTKIYAWYAERFAYFLDLLDKIPEGNGSLLDNSLVVWGSEIGKGNTHSFEKIPFVLAGGAANQLRTGRYLRFNNVEHNRLLVSICRMMGVTDVDKFGKTDKGTGPLAGLV